MSRIRRTHQARSDLTSIALYIGKDNVAAATRFLESIDAKLNLLCQHPELGEARPELATSLRSFVVRNYVLFYRTAHDGIELIRVLHAAQEVDTIF